MKQLSNNTNSILAFGNFNGRCIFRLVILQLKKKNIALKIILPSKRNVTQITDNFQNEIDNFKKRNKPKKYLTMIKLLWILK